MTTLDWLLTTSIIATVALAVAVDEHAYPHGRWTPERTQAMLTLAIASFTACLALLVMHTARATP